MKTKSIIIILLVFWVSLEAQNKSILQTKTQNVTGLGRLINPKLDKKLAQRNAVNNRLNEIQALNIFENRSRNDTTNSGDPNEKDIPVTDNTIACSSVDTTDFVVAAKNHRLYFLSYSPNIVTSATIPFQDFSSNHSTSLFLHRNDPKLIYDPIEDRYFLVFLYYEIQSVAPYQKADSRLYVFASTTNDPLNNSWYEIEITNTDVTSNLNWYDRPQVGISNEELFIAVNVYDKANDNYQDNLILALKKSDLLNGIKNMTVVDIQGNPPTDDLFGMVPVSHAQDKNFGPGLYFLRTDETADLDSVWYYQIPTNVYANPNLTIYKTGIALNSYLLGVSMSQKDTPDFLDVDNCRAFDALYLNNVLHYVYHAKGNTGNQCEAIYNRLDLSTNVNTAYRYSDYPSAYPSLASLTFDSTDKTFLMPYLTSDTNSYPGFRVVACVDSGAWSNDLLIHTGDTAKADSRWGDYVGAARFHKGLLPTCWIYGNYASPNYYDGTESYIAEIILTDPNGIANNILLDKRIKVFPNPTSRSISVEMPPISEFITISLVDIRGNLVANLYQGMMRDIPTHIAIGQYLKGMYVVTITNSQKKLIGYDKIIID